MFSIFPAVIKKYKIRSVNWFKFYGGIVVASLVVRHEGYNFVPSNIISESRSIKLKIVLLVVKT